MSFVGTSLYMAPEMILGKECTYACDLWAVGLILYKMFTGEDLFGGLNEFIIYEWIKHNNYNFEKINNQHLKDLLEKIVLFEMNEWLGIKDENFNRILSHSFFTTDFTN